MRSSVRSMIPELQDEVCDPMFSKQYQSTDGSNPPSEDETNVPEARASAEHPPTTAIDPNTEEEDNAAGPSTQQAQPRSSKGKGKATAGDEPPRTWYRRHPTYRNATVSVLYRSATYAPHETLQTRRFYERLDELVRQHRQSLPARTQARFNVSKRVAPADRNLPECNRRGTKDRFDKNLIPQFMCDAQWLQDHPEQVKWTQEVPEDAIPAAFRIPAADVQMITDDLIDPVLRD